METPDRIKKSLRIHSLPHPSGCIGCAYRGGNETKIPNGCADKLFKDVREYIKQLEARVPRWISVEERLPEGKVIAANFTPDTYGFGEMIIGYVDAVKAFAADWEPGLYVAENDHEILRHVSHWMPLPPMLKEEAK